MTNLAIAIIISCLISAWRWHDGSSKSEFRARSVFHWAFLQTTTPAVLCLIGGIAPVLLSPLPLFAYTTVPYILVAALVFYLLIRAPGGWEYWLPNRSASGERRPGTLLTYAAPMFVCGVLGLLVGLSAIGSVLTALVGLAPCAVYVLGTRLEERNRWPFRLTSEQTGRLSMGTLVFPLPLL